MKHRRSKAQWTGTHRCPARAGFLFAQGLRRHRDEAALNVRRAKAIAHVLDHYPVVIDEDDRLLGKLSTRPLTAAENDEYAALGELVMQEKGGLRYGPLSGGVGGHRTIDFESLMEHGVEGLLEQVQPSGAFYEACRVALEALLRFAERYRAAAEESGMEAAGLLSHVPARPPRTFHEALQSAWFVQFAMTFDDMSCTGHPDRYLWPFYRADMENGILTRDQALTLIEELYLRSNEVYGDWPETIMVGGTDRAGNAVCNDLTYLFIEAIETVGLVNPNVALCYRDDTPDDLLEACLDKISKGFSHPALYNDRVIIEGLLEAGLTPEDARYYQNSTCVEITPVGTSNVQVVVAQFNLVKALEQMLNDGAPLVDDPRLSASCRHGLSADRFKIDLESLDTFAAFLGVYKDLLSRYIDVFMREAVREETERMERGSSPLVSCFIRDCIERGKDAAAGGARYHYCGVNVLGFSSAVDSLSAVRTAVYEEKKVGVAELAQAIRDDFDGHEELRQYLANRCPRYGNDDPAVDALAADLYEFIREQISTYRTPLGGAFHIGCFSGWGGRLDGKRVSAHTSAGAYTGASPDGRRAGMPLSENIGPAPGADVTGLTAVINSVTCMDHKFGLGGISVNWRLSPALFKDPANRAKVLELIRVFMDQGGFEVQINVVDCATLKDARAHPEQHRNLVVRIAGYSEYFCNIGEAQQDAIIARTEYDEA